jgi:hypothetical protein
VSYLKLLQDLQDLALFSFPPHSFLSFFSSSRPVQLVEMLLSTLLSFGLFLGKAWAIPPHPHPPGPDHLGAVASESSVCSNIGIDILKEGGNAADAVCRSPPHPLATAS